ncbi:MAG: hypothetical protein IJ122_03320 [Methanobrevibacter sp.]|nr:hypothetical protein [Methanobrevibacter sp.]
MFTLLALAISLGCVSAADLDDTNSSAVMQSDNSPFNLNNEIDEINYENSVDDTLSSFSKSEVHESDSGDVLGDGVSISIVSGSTTPAVGETVKFKIGKEFDSTWGYYDTIYVRYDGELYQDSNGYITGIYGDVKTDTGIDFKFTSSGSHTIALYNSARGVNTNSLTINVGGSSTGEDPTPVTPTVDPTASLTIYDANYPSDTTITSEGDYTATIKYNLVKTGDGFSDESLAVTITDTDGKVTTSTVALNSQNTLGTLTITMDNTYTFSVTYTGTANGKTVTAKSNDLKYITKNTSNVDPQPVTPTDNTVTLTIYDANYPSNSIITSEGDYRATIMYNLVKSGDGFSDESLAVTITDTDGKVTTSTVALNSQNTLGTLTITMDNTYTFSVTYTATLNGQTITAKSNDLKYITKNTSNTSDTNNTGGNSTGNSTGGNATQVNSAKNVEIHIINSTLYYGGKISIEIVDSDAKAVTSGSATITYDGKTSTHNINQNGIITIDCGDIGSKNIEIQYADSEGNYNSKNLTSAIQVLSTIESGDLRRAYNANTNFKVKFYDANGNPLTDTDVKFTVNGNDYDVKTDANGVATFDNKLAIADYEITSTNPATGQTALNNISICERILENKDITMSYLDGSKFKVRVVGDNGNVVGAGETVTFKVNSATYKALTDANGYATLTIGFVPKTYTISTVYKGVTKTNKIKVKQILTAKNIKASKKKTKTIKYTATLKSNGKVLKDKKITFKFKGKKYTAKTNKKGVATIKIKNSYKVGKYTISITYVKDTIKKSIQIKK